MVPEYSTAHEQIEAFYQRQQADMQRRRIYPGLESHGNDRYESSEEESYESGSESDSSTTGFGGEGRRWRNAEGERLSDFGVDEEAEFYDEDDVPLGQLIERRKKKM